MELPQAGILTVRSWMLCPDGEQYHYIYCGRWRLMTDKHVPIADFHSRERWSAFATDMEGKIVGMIPGCEVVGFCATTVCPEKTNTTPHKADEPDNPPGVYDMTAGRGHK
jgi:hypothetical protein